MARITHASINRLASWIQEQLLAHTVGEREKPVNAFSLMYVEQSVQEREVKTIDIGGPVDPMALAKAFFDKASSYASEISLSGSGMHQFVIYAHIEGCTHEDAPHHPLKIANEATLFGNPGITGTEPPTAQGFMQQLMRHNEALVGAVVRMNDRLMNNAENIWTVQETAMRQRMETLQLTEAVITKAAEDEHNKMMQLRAHEQALKDKERLWNLLPVAAEMAGIDLPASAKSSMDTQIIDLITSKSSAEDLEMLLELFKAKLSPEEFLVMQTRMIAIIDQKKREAAAANGNGEHKVQ